LFLKKAADHNGLLSFTPSSVTLQRDQSFTATLIVDTSNQAVTGVDTVLNFDTNYLSISDITAYPTTSNFATYLPLNNAGSFDSSGIISRANTSGIIDFGAVTYDIANGSLENAFTGVKNPFAQVTFSVKSNSPYGTTRILYDYHGDGITNDSNIVFREVEDILQSPTSTITVNITQTLTPTLAPTLTPSISPTSILTPSPTSLPTPSPTGSPYPSENLIKNGSFEEDLSNWKLGTVRNARAVLTRDTTTRGEGLASAKVSVTTPESWLGSVQFVQDGIPLTAGRGYRLSFWASASVNRPIQIVMRRGSRPWTQYNVLSQNITTAWNKYTLTFTAGSSDPSSTVEFSLGQYASTVWLDGVELISVQTLGESTEAKPEEVPEVKKLWYCKVLPWFCR